MSALAVHEAARRVGDDLLVEGLRQPACRDEIHREGEETDRTEKKRV